MADDSKNQSKQAVLTPTQTPGRVKLKTWRGTVPISDSTSQFTVPMSGYVDMGGDGKCEVVSLELEPSTGLVYFSVKLLNGSNQMRQFVLQGEGAGEFA